MIRPPAASTKPLEQVERGSLGDEQSAGRADHLGDLLARRTAITVALPDGDLDVGIEQPERLERDVEPGEDAVGLHQEDASRLLVVANGRLGRDVAAADVLREGAADDVAVLRGSQAGKGLCHEDPQCNLGVHGPV